MKRTVIGRLAAAAGLLVAATITTVVVLAPTPALANVANPPLGSQPGGLHLSATSGTGAETLTYSTTTPCPAGFQSSADVVILDNSGAPGIGVLLTAPTSIQIANPAGFSGSFGFPMSQIQSFLTAPGVGSYEISVVCKASLTSVQFVQSTFVTFQASHAWTDSNTPPVVAGASATSVTANFTNVPFGTSITFTATVTPAGATGTVQFEDQSNANALLGAAVPLTGGSASLPFSGLQVGTHAIIAVYSGDATHNGSTSATPITVTIQAAGTSGSETINVNVPLSEGVFTLTVSPTPVQLSQATNNGTAFVSTGQLSAVTVNEQRLQSAPGWSISGQVSNFTSGGNVISGSSLGWTPQVTTQDPAADVVAGPAVAPGTSPGLSAGSGLANAAVNQGLGQSVLGAGLTLSVPLTTKVGAYSALLTLTAITHA
jgi:hypothetical protein